MAPLLLIECNLILHTGQIFFAEHDKFSIFIMRAIWTLIKTTSTGLLGLFVDTIGVEWYMPIMNCWSGVNNICVTIALHNLWHSIHNRGVFFFLSEICYFPTHFVCSAQHFFLVYSTFLIQADTFWWKLGWSFIWQPFLAIFFLLLTSFTH